LVVDLLELNAKRYEHASVPLDGGEPDDPSLGVEAEELVLDLVASPENGV
jgi:hypothetical protein